MSIVLYLIIIDNRIQNKMLSLYYLIFVSYIISGFPLIYDYYLLMAVFFIPHPPKNGESILFLQCPFVGQFFELDFKHLDKLFVLRPSRSFHKKKTIIFYRRRKLAIILLFTKNLNKIVNVKYVVKLRLISPFHKWKIQYLLRGKYLIFILRTFSWK